MAGGGGPAGGGELPPLRALALGGIDERIAGERNSGISVALRAEESVMRGGPVADRLQVVFVDQFGERLTPVMAHGEGFFAGVGGEEFRKVRQQIISTALTKLLQKAGSPVATVDLERIAENGVWWMIAEGGDELVRHIVQMVVDGFA